jgi:ferrochelatase
LKKEAIVLLNMGGPNNLEEVEVFLKNMFNDKNIITTKSALLRKFIATMITFTRTESSQKIYEELGGKSPLVGITKDLVKKLQEELKDDVLALFAMRYTPPFADEVCQKIEDEDIRDIYLIPLYPQYSTTTTKSSLEDFIMHYEKVGGNAKIHYIKNFYRNKTYNKAIISSIKEAIKDKDSSEYELIFSAHGLPQKIVDKGDPYQKQVQNHIEILKQMLKEEEINFSDIHLAYQSKVGPMKWLEPSLEDKLKELKTKKVIIFPIAFTIDNSETIYELDVEYKEVAAKLGFEDYIVARCPNDSDLFVKSLVEIYMEMKD